MATIKSIVQNPNQHSLQLFQKQIKKAGYTSSRQIVMYLKSILKSRSNSPTLKLNALKVIRICIDSQNPIIHKYIHKKLSSRFMVYALFRKDSTDRHKGLNLFQSQSLSDRQKSAEFLNMLLVSLKYWGKKYKQTDPNHFLVQMYRQLKHKGVVFPGLKSFSKELQGANRVIQNIFQCFSKPYNQVSSLKGELNQLKRYKLIFEKEIRYQVEDPYQQSLRELLVHTLTRIEDCMQTEQKWRNKKYIEEFSQEQVKIEVADQIEEPLPKRIPIDQINLSMQGQGNPLQEHEFKIQRQSTIKDKDEIAQQNMKLKESISDKEDLINFYKNDLMRMQSNYLQANQEKQEIKLQIFQYQQQLKLKKTPQDIEDIMSSYKMKSQFLEASIKQLLQNLQGLQTQKLKKQKKLKQSEFQKQVGLPFFDNQSFLPKSCIQEETVIMQNQDLKVGSSMKFIQNFVSIDLYIQNKTNNTLQNFFVIPYKFPANLKLMINFYTDSSYLSPSESFQFNITCRPKHPYCGFPILKIQWDSFEPVKYQLAIPIPLTVFFTPLQIEVQGYWNQLSEFSISDSFQNWKKCQELQKEGSFNLHKKFVVVRADGQSTYFCSSYESVPVVVQVRKKENLEVEVRCQYSLVRGIVAEIFKMLVEIIIYSN